METEDIFKNASNRARTLKNVSEDDMLRLYGLYKQANEGACNTDKPYFWDFTATAKWKSWKSFSNLSREEAQRQYICLVKNFDPEWVETTVTVTQNDKPSGMGVSVSTMAYEDEKEIPDKDKTVFDWCKFGDLDQISHLIKNNQTLIYARDDNHLSLLHWAVDRGHIKIVQYLIDVGCEVNLQDEDGQTPLHYAATCEHEDIVKLLLKSGADQTIKDTDGNLPFGSVIGS